MASAQLEIVAILRDKAGRAVDGLQGKLGKLGGAMGKALKASALIGGVALVGLGIGALKMAADFDKAFGEVSTLLAGVDTSVIDGLRSGVKDLAKEMGIDATKATEALYQAISAGVPPENAIAFLRDNAKLAIGGVTDLATAVDLTTTVLNAFGLEQSELGNISDVMFTAVKQGKTTIDELGASLFQVAPTAAGVGVSIEEVAASLATLTAKGFPTAQATTGMNAALAELSKGGTVASDTFESLAGKSFPDFIAEGGNLVDAFALMKEGADLSDKSLIDMFGSIEAGKAVMALAEGGEFAANLDAMGDSAGATDEAFNTMNETFGRQVDLLKGQLKGVMLDVGEKVLPILTDAMMTLTPWIQENLPKAIELLKEKWEDIQPHLETARDVMVRVGEVVRDRLLPPLRSFMRFIATNQEVLVVLGAVIGTVLFFAFMALAVAAGAAAVGVIAATWPLIVLGAVIGLFILGLIALVKHWDEITAFMKGAWDAATSFIIDKVVWLKDQIVAKFTIVFDFLKRWGPLIAAIILSMFLGPLPLIIYGIIKYRGEIMDVFRAIPGLLLGLVSKFLDAGKSLGAAIKDGLLAGLKAVGGFIGSLADEVFSAIKSVINIGIRAINNMIPNSIGFKKAGIGVTIDIPDNPIPELAAGGLVMKPTLALLGEAGPEAVIPLGRAGPQLAGAGASTFNFNGTIVLGGAATRDDAEELVDMIEDIWGERRLRGL